jgi:hypothetical protein
VIDRLTSAALYIADRYCARSWHCGGDLGRQPALETTIAQARADVRRALDCFMLGACQAGGTLMKL